MRYTLHIFEPGSVKNLLKSRDAAVPFMTFAVGDFINAGAWRDAEPSESLLRIVAIEHTLIEVNDLPTCHRIGIYTESVEPDALFGRVRP